MTFSNFIFLDLGVHHLPRGLRGGCRRGEDVDAPDQDIDNDIDDDGDYTDAPDQDIALVMMMMVIMWTNLLHFRLFSELLPPERKIMSLYFCFYIKHLAIKSIVQFCNFDTLEFETANTIFVVGSKILHMCEISKLGNMHAGDSEVEFQASSSNDTEFLRMSNTVATHHQLFSLLLSLISLSLICQQC